MFKYWCARHKYAILFYIVLSVYAGYSIGRAYGFTFFPDEFGYWSYAAKAAGYDWSHITSLGSYYSYGYSLVLFPIFILFKSPVTAYRVAVGLNFVLIGMTYPVLERLGQRLCGMKQDESQIASFVAVCYPSLLFYGKSTLTEVVLSVVFVVIVGGMYKFLTSVNIVTLFLIISGLVYLYLIHMRAVGVIISGIITLIIYCMMKNDKFRYIVIALGIVCVAVLIGIVIKNMMLKATYNSEDTISNISDYAGQIYKIKYIFTKNGVRDFTEGFFGKVLYMGLSTFGLAWFGIIHSVRKISSLKNDKCNIVYIFVLLSLLAELMINTIYNIYPLWADSVVYGRYHEFVFPILILFGIFEIMDMCVRYSFVVEMVIVFGQVIFSYLVIDCVGRYGLNSYRGYMSVGMSYLYNNEGFDHVKGIWLAYGFGVLLTMMVYIVCVVTKKTGKQSIIMVLGLIEVFLVLRVSNLYTDNVAIGTYRDLGLVGKIENLKYNDSSVDGNERRIVYITDGDNSYISVIQFMMRDETINLLPLKDSMGDYSEEELDEDDILLLYYESDFISEAQEKYDCSLMNGHFCVLYNIIGG